MFYRVSSIQVSVKASEEELKQAVAKKLGIRSFEIDRLRIYRRSLDSRKHQIRYCYTVDAFVKPKVAVRYSPFCKMISEEYSYSVPRISQTDQRPIVVGFGPAGMFSALLLARAGLQPIVLERGKPVEQREKDVCAFCSEAKLDPESNVQFGEGGAGTFSDGKLNTLLKDKNFRGRFVLEEFVRAGAPEEILFESKPHIGTDRLRDVVRRIRGEILSLGGSIRFSTRFLRPILRGDRLVGALAETPSGIEEIECDALFLAIGHSARDTIREMAKQNIVMEKKIFSVGVRIEHLQEKIDLARYGLKREEYALPPADYKLAVPTSSGKSIYTFCMCPGGQVVPATGTVGAVVTNGMSRFAREGVNANSALLWNVHPWELEEDLFAGFRFQEHLERRAFEVGGGDYRAPCQRVEDFLQKKPSVSFGEVLPSYSIGTRFQCVDDILPPAFCDSLREGIVKMGALLPGFDDPDALLTAVESRATCPIRIVRGENFQASVLGLYPIGEGAGYAGGIMSSAMDGMKAVEAYLQTKTI